MSCSFCPSAEHSRCGRLQNTQHVNLRFSSELQSEARAPLQPSPRPSTTPVHSPLCSVDSQPQPPHTQPRGPQSKGGFLMFPQRPSKPPGATLDKQSRGGCSNLTSCSLFRVIWAAHEKCVEEYKKWRKKNPVH